ncbi:hypothetical protein [Nakamurella lactea]|uniref:hypothetical protein n=1 Tax=Nakamurella lactea TaxID=459515 RepID=UPI001B7FB333|nr:hypothetical protein [Nakamurella lactea]
MTQVSRTLPTPQRHADQVAQAAAQRAGVTVDEVVSPGRLKDVEQLFRTVWETDRDRPPISADVLRALVHSGSYVAAAYTADGRLAAAGVGFLATDVRSAEVGGTESPVASMHSHIAAVAPGTERHGIGSALKLHQRGWAIRRGLRSITWTFDPLVRRNAGFNAHLGAEFVRYYPDFYGEMADGRNAGQGSDRLLARWDLQLPAVPRVAVEPVGDRQRLLEPDGDGRPVAGTIEGDRAWVATPANIEQLRRVDPDLAGRWRIAVRDAMEPLQSGWRIDGFTAGGSYLLVRE